MIAPVTHILSLTQIQRSRLLPAAGNILVRVGQKVSATDVIAETYRFHNHTLVDVGKALQPSADERVEDFIQVKAGDTIEAGDVIAMKKGMFRKVIRAQQAGTIFSVTGGQIWIELPGVRMELRAGYSGIINEIVSDRGVVITLNGALIQAAWGNGKIEESRIVYYAQSEDEVLLPETINLAYRGGIMLCGHCNSAEALRMAAQLPLRGIILGSMSAELVPLAISMPFPIILTEGFGLIPMNHNAYTILTSNRDRAVTMFAVNWEPDIGNRPEITIPLPAEGPELKEVTGYRSGQQVRFINKPVAGEIGILENVDINLGMAVVRLATNQKLSVPLVNIDVID